MGIRFLCSSCQNRLNVKTRQAGQFCICPECESEIQIPLESTILPIKKKRSKKRRGKSKSHVEVELTPVTAAASEQHSVELPVRPKSALPLPPASTVSSEVEVDSVVVGTEPAAEMVSSETDEEGSLAAAPPIHEMHDSPTLVDQKSIESANLFVSPKQHGNTPVAEEQNVQPEATEVKEYDSKSTVTSSASIDSDAEFDESRPSEPDFYSDDYEEAESAEEAESFLLAKPAVKINGDPLKSDPDLVWYLRHKRLGEKGPLKARQVEAMLESGQLRAGFIVWREDWNDWVPAEKIFPQLAEKPSEPAYKIPDELNPHSEVSRKRRSQKRFWMCFNAAAFLIVIVLVYWLTQFGW